MIVDTVLNILAGGAVAILARESFLIHRERKALSRTREWYVSRAEGEPMSSPIQMCGGCGVFLTEEQISQCPGQNCDYYLRQLKNMLEPMRP